MDNRDCNKFEEAFSLEEKLKVAFERQKYSEASALMQLINHMNKHFRSTNTEDQYTKWKQQK
jgi:hypothetical protein